MSGLSGGHADAGTPLVGFRDFLAQPTRIKDKLWLLPTYYNPGCIDRWCALLWEMSAQFEGTLPFFARLVAYCRVDIAC